MKNLALSGLAAVLALAAPRAYAGSASSQFAVTASVVQNCTISAGTLAFGSYDPVVANAAASQNLDATSTISVACTKGSTGVTIGLDQGTSGTRTMKDTASLGTLTYLLFSDSARGLPWTTAVGSTVALPVPTSKAPTSITVYGRVAGGQDAPVGTGYTDTVTATVNF